MTYKKRTLHCAIATKPHTSERKPSIKGRIQIIQRNIMAIHCILATSSGCNRERKYRGCIPVQLMLHTATFIILILIIFFWRHPLPVLKMNAVFSSCSLFTPGQNPLLKESVSIHQTLSVCYSANDTSSILPTVFFADL